MELQNADTLRWHVYEILTNDVPLLLLLPEILLEVACIVLGQFLRSDVYISRRLRRY